jgi:hypothetical protein
MTGNSENGQNGKEHMEQLLAFSFNILILIAVGGAVATFVWMILEIVTFNHRPHK